LGFGRFDWSNGPMGKRKKGQFSNLTDREGGFTRSNG